MKNIGIKIAGLVVVAIAIIGIVIYLLREVPGTTTTPAVSSPVASGNATRSAATVASRSDSAMGAAAQPQPGAAEQSSRKVPATLSEVLAQRDSMARMRGMLDFVEQLPAGDIAGALDQLGKLSPPWDNEARMLAHLLLTRLGREQPDAALARLNTLDLRKHGADAASILAGIASQDPARAIAWLNDPANRLTVFPEMGQILAGSVAREWGRQDAEAAMNWARTLPDDQRTGAYTGILGSLAGKNPASAATLALQLEPGGARTFVVGQIAEAWGKTAPFQALAWAQSLEGDEQRVAMTQALGSWAQTQPAEAARYLDNFARKENTDAHLRTIVGTWATLAPADAAAWLSSYPEGPGKNAAMGHVLWNWTNLDPEQAANWIAAQPASPSRDSGIGGLAIAAFPRDPEAALSWAKEMTDETRRTYSLNIGLKEWLKRDPVAAQNWAQRNGVPLPQGGGK